MMACTLIFIDCNRTGRRAAATYWYFEEVDPN